MVTRFDGDNKDPAVNVTTWALLVTIVFSVSARLLTKFRLFKKLTVDDLLITTSLVRSYLSDSFRWPSIQSSRFLMKTCNHYRHLLSARILRFRLRSGLDMAST